MIFCAVFMLFQPLASSLHLQQFEVREFHKCGFIQGFSPSGRYLSERIKTGKVQCVLDCIISGVIESCHRSIPQSISDYFVYKRGKGASFSLYAPN